MIEVIKAKCFDSIETPLEEFEQSETPKGGLSMDSENPRAKPTSCEDEIKHIECEYYEDFWKYRVMLELASKHDYFDIDYKVNDNIFHIHYERKNNFKDIYEMAYKQFKNDLKYNYYVESSSKAIKNSVKDMNKLIEYVIVQNDIENINYLISNHPLAFRRRFNILTAIKHENYEAYKLMEPLYTFGDYGVLVEASLRNKSPDIFKDLIQKHPIRKVYRLLDKHEKREWQKYISKS